MNEAARILVVDDDESIRKSFSPALEGAGYVVDTAENGTDAVKMAEAGFYNLVLIDIRLPDMEGTKLLSTLKETRPKMVKIIITGYPSLQNAVEAVNKGADAYIIKPVKMDELLEMVKEHLMKQQEARGYDEEKIKEFIDTRIKEQTTKEERPPTKRTQRKQR
jgi:DNA-binding NtrC family response regulator